MAKPPHRKVRVGEVISNSMDKTVVVKIVKKMMHPVFKKYIKKTKKLYAEDTENRCKVGDKVEVIECRPVSKTKRWKVYSILTEQKGA